MIPKDHVLKLYESCHITIGANRSIIIDVLRKSYFLVPNGLAKLFDDNNVMKIDSSNIDEDELSIIGEYKSYLIANELAFICKIDDIENFPRANIIWDFPAKITNAIFEIKSNDFDIRLEKVKLLINRCLTRHIEVHIVNPINLTELDAICNSLDDLDLNNYNLIFSLEDNELLENSIKIIKSHYKIFRTIISNTGKNEMLLAERSGWNNIFLFETAFSYKYCGLVNSDYFSTGIEHVFESYNYNTCLNRKIAVDVEGNIKNCPNMQLYYGNISEVNIDDIIASNHFQELWKVTKDHIKVCKDCEFRHICTDCRAYIEDPNDKYSKPLKCGYDPYINEWEDWSTNPIKNNLFNEYLSKQNN